MHEVGKREALIPVKGAWVAEPGNETETAGRVIEAGLDEGEVRVQVQWLKPKSRGKRWHAPEDLSAGFKIGMVVQHCPSSMRESEFGEGVVRDVRRIGGRNQVLVDFQEAGIQKWLPFQHLSHIAGVHQRFITGQPQPNPGDAERLRMRSLAYALELWNENTGSLSHLHIDPLPHQIHLVHHILRSGHLNWMIADDVGLGKTIEVGMLLSAIKQRGRFKRILIVAPSGVMIQWQEELRYKFNMDDFRIYGRDFEVHDENHWKLYDHVIASMDRLKQTGHLESLLNAAPWDLIIFDEAHRLTRRQYGNKFDSSQRFDLAAQLRTRTDSMLLLTATPHQGMQDKFQGLLELLRPDRKHQIRTLGHNPEILEDMIFRNNKADVTDSDGNFIFRGKTTRAISVEVSEEAREFDRQLQAYLRRGYQAGSRLGKQGFAIGFVMTVYRKLAASSVAAIHRALLRRRGRLEEEAQQEGIDSHDVPIWLPEGPEDIEDERYLGEFEEFAVDKSARQFFEGEIETLDALINKAKALLHDDKKLESFIEHLVELVRNEHEGEKILVFTEYRATQEYLQRALEERFGESTVQLIHGGQNNDERRTAIAQFEDDGQFLISTEAGGEGINLQRRCHIMVNYDLPWNPMRLVQRIGRLYRYGQTRRVIVFNMHAPETIDANVLETMYERLAQVVHDMANVGTEFREGLEDDILGEMADLLDLDVSGILEDAMTEGAERTQKRIDEALHRAREATEKQRELFAYVSGYDPDQARDELRISHNHLRSFVEGMFAQTGIQITKRLHGDLVWEIQTPDNVREVLPGLPTRRRVTLDRTWAADRSDVHMLDMESSLMQYLLQRAKQYDFGGRAAGLQKLDGDALLMGVLRWQDNHGKRMRQEFIAIQVHSDGETEVNSDAVNQWLLSEAQDGPSDVFDQSTAKKLYESAKAATEKRLEVISNPSLHPENRQWIGAGW